MTKEHDTQLIVKLLSQTTTLSIVKEFLKQKGLAYSAGSWDELFHRRINPAVVDGVITNAELVNFLKEIEEFGNQHIFLFKCLPLLAQSIIDPSKAEPELKKLGLWDLVLAPQTLEEPNDPTLSEIRWENTKHGQVLIFKVSETRVYEKLESETHEDGGISRKYCYVRERAISIAKLHSDGCLELRIPSRSSSYTLEISRLFKLLPLINKADFSEVSLTAAKKKIWIDRESLSKVLRFGKTTLMNDQGNIIILAAGSKSNDLALDKGAVGSTDIFLDEHGSWDGINVWFNESPKGPTEDIHVIVNGLMNEFAVPANCKKLDYEYVLAQLKTFNS